MSGRRVTGDTSGRWTAGLLDEKRLFGQKKRRAVRLSLRRKLVLPVGFANVIFSSLPSSRVTGCDKSADDRELRIVICRFIILGAIALVIGSLFIYSMAHDSGPRKLSRQGRSAPRIPVLLAPGSRFFCINLRCCGRY
jgi:hypothetical protein